MDGAQMDAYYGDQLYVLERAIDDLAGVNWYGLHNWLSAKATWTDPPLRPDRLAIIREHAVKLCDVSNQDRDPASDPDVEYDPATKEWTGVQNQERTP